MKARVWVAAIAGAIALFALRPWLAPPAPGGGPGASVNAMAASPAPAPGLDEALQAMRNGLTMLRQAAKTGEPSALQEAEREILLPLLDALAAAKVDGRVDRGRYLRVVEGVTEVQGLFKEIPYFLEVRPGDGLPPFRLLLRRSPYPAIMARTTPLGWQVRAEGDGVVLTP